MARMSNRGYIIKPLNGGPTIAFITEKDPKDSRRNIWRKTDPCVLLVPCSGCGAKIGQLCRSLYTHEEHSTTHARRRSSVDRHAIKNFEKAASVMVDITKLGVITREDDV